MRLFFLPALVASGLLCFIASGAQAAPYSRTGMVAGRPAMIGARIWAAPVVADIFEANPLDDGYDYPFGYGEYAIYGRWALGTDCYLLRRKVLTGYGYRWRTIRRCD